MGFEVWDFRDAAAYQTLLKGFVGKGFRGFGLSALFWEVNGAFLHPTTIGVEKHVVPANPEEYHF